MAVPLLTAALPRATSSTVVVPVFSFQFSLAQCRHTQRQTLPAGARGVSDCSNSTIGSLTSVCHEDRTGISMLSIPNMGHCHMAGEDWTWTASRGLKLHTLTMTVFDRLRAHASLAGAALAWSPGQVIRRGSKKSARNRQDDLQSRKLC